MRDIKFIKIQLEDERAALRNRYKDLNDLQMEIKTLESKISKLNDKLLDINLDYIKMLRET